MSESRFDSHPMDSKTFYYAESVKDIFKNIENEIETKLVDSREKALCLTKLEEASFWTTRCLAKYGLNPVQNEDLS